ncbi:hypothetical protein D9M68_862580 [compost metagenome]
MIPLRKVRAADAAGEQHVAHESALRLGRLEHHMARRVAGAVAHVQRAVPDLHRVAVGEPARGRERAGRRKTEHGALLRQAVDPELVTRMRTDDWQIQFCGEFCRTARVVDVRVGEPDRLERDAQALHFGQQPVQVASGVDDGRILGFIAPDDGAVLGEGSDGDSEIAQHGKV